MGQPKALLDFGGQPLWKRQMEKLQALAPNELFLSFPPSLPLPSGPWQGIHDEKVGLGPLSGLHAALRTMQSKWLVVLAVDLPDMTPAFLQNLYDLALAKGCGVVPQLDGFHQCLAAI